MSHDDKNDELRQEHLDQEARRQKLRDAAAEDGSVADLGSQDARRETGDERH